MSKFTSRLNDPEKLKKFGPKICGYSSGLAPVLSRPQPPPRRSDQSPARFQLSWEPQGPQHNAALQVTPEKNRDPIDQELQLPLF